MDRIILHSDLNSFYATAECVFNPEYYGKALVVGGNSEMRHGIVLAKSEAAKKAGVTTGEAIWEAERKCPGLIVVPPHFDRYLILSQKVRGIYSQYTDQVEPFGIDECWLDVSGSTSLFGNGEKIALELRNRIKKETGLTVSVGVSFNKIFAKLGSDMKKPDATTLLPREVTESVVWKQPVGAMLGIGKKTEELLRQFGIYTLGQLANLKEDSIKYLLGKNGVMLRRAARGEDTSPVLRAWEMPPPKSIGRGVTMPHDMIDDNEVFTVMGELVLNVGERLRGEGMKASGISLALRDRDLNWQQFQGCLDGATYSTREIFRSARRLFSARYDWHLPLRSVTVSAIRLSREDGQYSILPSLRDREEKLDLISDSLAERYGKRVLYPASQYNPGAKRVLEYCNFLKVP